MAITPEHIRTTVRAYLAAHPEEQDDLAPITQLLDAGADLASRTEFRGHVTAGAVLTSPEGVLFIRHRALGRWLMPGGHVEPGDTSLLDAALRELAEETGIPGDQVTVLSAEPVHIDIRPIPASPARGEPAHQHIDFRYLMQATAAQALRLQDEEVTGAAWRKVSTVEDWLLRKRLAALPGLPSNEPA